MDDSHPVPYISWMFRDIHPMFIYFPARYFHTIQHNLIQLFSIFVLEQSNQDNDIVATVFYVFFRIF